MEKDSSTDIEGVDPSFICPLTLCVMTDPLMTREGLCFEHSAILEWLGRGNHECPLTRRPLQISKLVRNRALRARIQEWRAENDDLTERETETAFEDQCYVPTMMEEYLPTQVPSQWTQQERDDIQHSSRRWFWGRMRRTTRGARVN
jgi:hypothetical protein